MEIRLHVRRWNKDRAAEADEESTALVHGVLELDGKFITNGEVKISTEGGGIVRVTADLIASSLEIVEHSTDTWNQLPQ